MSNLELPITGLRGQKRLNQGTGLAGAAVVGDGTADEARRPGVARRLVRGIGDGQRMRLEAADLRRIRL